MDTLSQHGLARSDAHAGMVRTSTSPLATCPLCGSTAYRERAAFDRAVMVSCSDCGLVRQLDGSFDATVYRDDYYESDRPTGGYANYVRDADINRRTFASRLRRIEARIGKPGRLLDVGCALGDFVLEAMRRGWSADGLEVSAFAAAQARARGARVHHGLLGPQTISESSYDVITMYDTLEHTDDPVGMLREVRRALAPGGLAHIVTPNVTGLQSRVFGRRWYHYKPDEHLVYFGPHTLRRACESAGLEWGGSARTGSYVTVAYVLDRLRVYSPVFRTLGHMTRALRLDNIVFHLHAGEIEAWARRPS